METFKFHNLVQGNEQSIDQYLTDLSERLCEFKCTKATCGESYEDRMIRDQLIIGLKCNESQLRLLRKQALTTEKILEYCKSIELSKEHIKFLTKEEDVNFVKQCPAFNKTCDSCQVKGHFAKDCPNRNEETCEGSSKKNADPPRAERTVNTVQEEENKDNLIYVYECHSKSKNSWYETLMVTGKEVKFKLDSGADISILPKYIFDSLSSKLLLNKSLTTLVAYGNFKFKPVGEVFLECQYKNSSCKLKFLIVDFNAEPILGLSNCIKFDLIKRVNVIETTLPTKKEDILIMFKTIFQGLGRMPGYCNIELSDDAKPVIQYSRKIPLSMHDKLKETLDSLEEDKVIEKVEYPTEWVNNLLIVEKKPSNKQI
ncbi:uncharacterized protein [Diabrotica undecimpunctata]|uniref:uncharacterized protein n=1 Tax=Diabrotica undecimpunctata TaxID=50387 RepID=UPI003B6374AE